MTGPMLVRLRDLGKWAGGNTPSKANASYWTSGTVPWVSPKDMKVEEITSSEDRITESALRDGRVALVPQGSVLFVTRSGILAHTFPVAITRLPVTINQDLKALTPKSSVSAKYVAHAVRGASRRILKECSKHGTTVASIETNALLDFEIPMVDLDKQHRIVAEIEKQFSRLDEAVANLKRVKANLKRYKAAVLKAAVEGRLVPTEVEVARHVGRTFESGSDLLERILGARVSVSESKGRNRPPIGPDSTLDFELPEGWTFASLDQLATKITSGSRDWSPYYDRGRSIFVLAQNVRPFTPDFSVTQYVDPPDGDPSRERSRVKAGDLLATIVGANTGHVCLVEEPPAEAYVCQSVALIRPAFRSLGAYVNYWLNSDEHGQRYFECCLYGQGRPHLSFDQLKAAPIALPPAAEQERIVAEVEHRLSIVREVEAEVDANLTRAAVVRGSIIGQAFGDQ